MAPPSVERLLVLLFFGFMCSSALHPSRIKLDRHKVDLLSSVSSISLPPEFKTHYYAQTLDHFNYKPESYATFQQKYILNFKYWGGAYNNSPIFVFLGAESPIIYDAQDPGFFSNLTSHFNALQLYIEHRYYGDSMPFGSKDQAFQNSTTLGYLSSEQALADYAQIIVDVKKNLSAENCPVVAVGASYGGMLASWFRLKYPHVVIGALASSAPILYFDDITPQNGYASVVTKDFRNVSETCYNTIRQSWSEIDRVAAQANGLLTLTNIFSTCGPLNTSQELKDFLTLVYKSLAQYDNYPDHLVMDICRAMDGAPEGTDILGRVAVALNTSLGNQSCNYVGELGINNKSAWAWQKCTEMVMPIGNGDNDTMLSASPFDINNYTKDCFDTFKIVPRPHWATTEFGGHNITTVLRSFASNIVFSNGLRDPYSSGGVLENISDTVIAIHTEQGAHCLDLHSPLPSDPHWLVAQRNQETETISVWIAEYYAKLAAMSAHNISHSYELSSFIVF